MQNKGGDTMFEIVALVTQIGTSEPLEVRLNHPFESVKRCEVYKEGNEFAELKKDFESSKHFSGLDTYKAGTLKFRYECQERNKGM
jgi:hypothetical protein